MLSPVEVQHLESIAWSATKGIVGEDAAIPGGVLYDSVLEGLMAICEAAYRRGVDASMVQLSLVPDGAHVVG